MIIKKINFHEKLKKIVKVCCAHIFLLFDFFHKKTNEGGRYLLIKMGCRE